MTSQKLSFNDELSHLVKTGSFDQKLCLTKKMIDTWKEPPEIYLLIDAIDSIVKNLPKTEAHLLVRFHTLQGRARAFAGENENALRYLMKAVEEGAQTHDDQMDEAISQFREVAIRFGQPERALDILLPIAKSQLHSWELLYSIGLLCKEGGNLVGAEQYLRQITANKTTDPIWRSSAHQDLGIVLELKGLFKNAIEEYQKSLELLGPDGSPLLRSACNNDLAVVYWRLSQLDKAAEYAGRAIDLATKSGSESVLATALLNRGNICADGGQQEMAIRHYNNALVHEALAGERNLEAILLCNIATSYLELGELFLHVRYLNWALDAARELEQWPQQALCLLNLASTSDPDEARSLYLESLALYKHVGDEEGVVSANLGISRMFGQLGEIDEAIKYARGALETAERISDLWAMANANFQLADLHKRVGHIETAWTNSEKAFEDIERVRQYTSVEEIRDYLQKQSLPDYIDAASLALQGWRNSDKLHKPEWVWRLFTSLERSRSRALLDALGHKKSFEEYLFPYLIPEECGTKLAELTKQIRDLRDRLLLHKSGQGAGEARYKELRESLQQAEQSHKEYLTWLKQSFTRFAASTSTDVIPQDEFKNLIKSDTAIIEFADIKDNIVSVVWRRESGDIFDYGLNAKDLHDIVQDFQLSCSEPGRRIIAQELGTKLFETLIRPLEEQGLLRDARQLIIVPSGNLFRMPFEALWAGDFLFRRYDISYLPSASMLSFLQVSFSQSKVGLVMGDPLDNLPHARKEVSKIGKLFPELLGDQVILGNKATRRSFIRFAEHADIIHIASHATFADDASLFSFIEFASDAKDKQNRLEVGDILSLPLKARLVVLSGCETGKMKTTETNELVGFVRAFLSSGVSAVLVSLWKLNDEATAEFMTIFYQGFLKESFTIQEALRRARDQLSGSRQYCDPYYWAPFVIYGADSL